MPYPLTQPILQLASDEQTRGYADARQATQRLIFTGCQSTFSSWLDALDQALRRSDGFCIDHQFHCQFPCLHKPGSNGDFLKPKETRALRREQHFTSGAHSVDDTGPDILARARRRIEELLACCHRPTISPDREQALVEFTRTRSR